MTLIISSIMLAMWYELATRVLKVPGSLVVWGFVLGTIIGKFITSL